MIERMTTSASVFRKVTIGALCIGAAACGGTDDIGSGTQAQSAPRMALGNGGYSTPITPEEHAAWEARRAANGAVRGANVEPPSSTEQALAIAAASNPDELIPLFIGLDNPEFDFTRLAGADDVAREAIIAERQRQVDEVQSPVIERLTQLGGVVDSTFWAATTIVARVPAQFVATVATWSEVTVVQYNDPNLVDVSD